MSVWDTTSTLQTISNDNNSVMRKQTNWTVHKLWISIPYNVFKFFVTYRTKPRSLNMLSAVFHFVRVIFIWPSAFGAFYTSVQFSKIFLNKKKKKTEMMAHFLRIHLLAFVPNVFRFSFSHKTDRQTEAHTLWLIIHSFIQSVRFVCSFSRFLCRIVWLLCARVYTPNVEKTYKRVHSILCMVSWSIEANGKLHPFHISIRRFFSVFFFPYLSVCIFSGLHLMISKVSPLGIHM